MSPRFRPRFTQDAAIEKLKMQLAVLRRRGSGVHSEKLDRAVEQLELLIGDIEESQAEIEAKAEAAAQSDTLGSSPSKRRRRPSVARHCPITYRKK